MINLFIDTNIWLAMFHLSKDDLKELNKLKELIGKEIKIEQNTKDWRFRL